MTTPSTITSPGIDQFRLNPFRILRLATAASAQEAQWRCERVLARARVGMTPQEPDCAAWLAGVTPHEVIEAAQVMESPHARIVEQLLWFDFAEDPAGHLLEEALITQDAPALQRYSNQPVDNSWANQINQVNLRLLLAFSALRGIGGPLPPTPDGEQAVELDWRPRGRLTVASDPHVQLRARSGFRASWVRVVSDSVQAWARLLSHRPLAEHIRARIVALADEMLGVDDVEAVITALRTRLADLIVGETRLELQHGMIENVAQLAEVAGRSEIGSEIWLVAFKPLRGAFMEELGLLEPEAVSGGGPLADLSSYLDRLAILVARWKTIDPANLLGLRTLIDEAVGQTFSRMKGLDDKERQHPDLPGLVDRLGGLAASNSIRERLKTFQEQLKRRRGAICHFCRKRDGEEHSNATLVGQNAVSIRAVPLARCAPCARRHRQLERVRVVAQVCVAVAGGSFALLTMHAFDTFLGGLLATALVVGAVWLVGVLATWAAGRRITPAEHRRYGDFTGATAADRLRGEGLSDFRFVSSRGAIARIENGGLSLRDADGLPRYAVRLAWKATRSVLFFVAVIFLGLFGVRFRRE